MSPAKTPPVFIGTATQISKQQIKELHALGIEKRDAVRKPQPGRKLRIVWHSKLRFTLRYVIPVYVQFVETPYGLGVRVPRMPFVYAVLDAHELESCFRTGNTWRGQVGFTSLVAHLRKL